MIRSYPNSGITVEAVMELLSRPAPWTGVTMSTRAFAEFRVSVHNLDNGDPSHRQWILEILEINVAQREAIPCLRAALVDIYLRMILDFSTPPDTSALSATMLANFNQSVVQNGVTASSSDDGPEYNRQLADKHLPRIIGEMISSHIQSDVTARRLTAAQAKALRAKSTAIAQLTIQKLAVEQQAKCHYSHIPLAIERDSYRRFSFERLDNSLPHFGPDGNIDNIVFVCRFFNTRGQMNRRKLLTILTKQPLVPLPADVRERAEAELDVLVEDKRKVDHPVAMVRYMDVASEYAAAYEEHIKWRDALQLAQATGEDGLYERSFAYIADRDRIATAKLAAVDKELEEALADVEATSPRV